MLRSLRRTVSFVLAFAGGSFAALPATALLSIVEVSYDAGGADDEREWVELWNSGDTPVDLSTWSLGWGGTSLVSGQQTLSGVIEAGARFLIGGPLGDTTEPPLSFDLPIDFDPDLQNGGVTADAIALFDLPADEVDAETWPADVVLYGESNDSLLLDPSGAVAPVHVADAPGGASIERGPGGVWRVQPEPTPGGPPQPVPEPARGPFGGVAAATALWLRRALVRAERLGWSSKCEPLS